MSKAEDLTPAHLRCEIAASCPSIHRLEDGRLLIVGYMLGRSEWPEGLKVGIEEMPVIIPPELLDELRAEWIRETYLYASE